MSTQAAFNPRIDLPPVSELVDSFGKSASSVLGNFETRNSLAKHAVPLAAPQLVLVKRTAAPAFWTEPAPMQTSRLGRSGALAIVVLVHVLAAIGLAGLREQVKPAEAKSLQVAIIAAPQSEDSLPPPPKPVTQPVYTLPVEPVYLDIADPETTAITVAARPAEAVASPPAVATGTPKTVSSVEYVREPQPKYPSAARALKQRGTVMLRVLVDTNGRASEVNLHRTSGYRVLDDAARKAVLDAQFKPYMENGHALPVYVFVPIEFGAV